MSAIRNAIELYGSDFSRVHGIYLEHGYTYSDPDILALARPCCIARPQSWVELRDADAWWVQLVIGHGALAALYNHLPFPLPKIGWARDFNGKREERFYDFQRLKSLLIKTKT